MAGNVKGGRASALARELKRNSNPSQPEAPLDRPLCNVMSPQTTEERTKRREENVSQWEQFKALYPVHRLDEEPAARAWVSREEEAEAILTGLRLVVTSEEWTRDGGKYVPKASRFIGEGMYADAARLGKPKESKRRPYFDPRTITG